MSEKTTIIITYIYINEYLTRTQLSPPCLKVVLPYQRAGSFIQPPPPPSCSRSPLLLAFLDTIAYVKFKPSQVESCGKYVRFWTFNVFLAPI